MVDRDPFALPELDHPTRQIEDTIPLAPAPVSVPVSIVGGVVGAKLGPKIAEGGMAELRLAFVRGDDDRAISVVLKRIRPEMRHDAEVTAMFREEMRICSQLSHPNIVRAIGCGELDGDPYIAFELLDAVSVRTLAALGPIPVAPALAIASGVLCALDYAAAFELVHRDVTPENVLVTRDGVVKLVDFGIARFRGRELDTVLGDLKGKERYMAPEQVALMPVDARADLYALGVMLDECSARPRPAALDALIARWCSTDPTDRPVSAAAALVEIENVPREGGSEALESFVTRVHFLREVDAPARRPMRARMFWSLTLLWLIALIAGFVLLSSREI